MASPWLRFCLVGWRRRAAGGRLGAGELGAAHDGLAALALPPLAALVVAAWFRHRRVLPYAVAALGLFGAAAHVRRAASILRWRRGAGAALVVTALVHRERWAPLGAVGTTSRSRSRE